MELSLNSAVFAEAATYASKTISQRPVKPVLGGILIEAATDQILLSGSDYTESSRTTVQAEVATAGNVLLHAGMFTNIVRKLGKRTMKLTVDGSKATITAGTAVFSLAAMDLADYPTIHDVSDVAGTVDGAALAYAVEQVTGAVASDLALPILCAVNISATGDKLTFRATDRYRLAEAVIPWTPAGDDFMVNVKGKWLADMSKQTAGATSLLHDGNLFGIRSGQRASTTTVVDGDFPKIASLFPNHTPTVALLDRQELADVLDRVSLVAERNTPVRLVFSAETVTVDAGTGEDAQAQETIDCELDGDPITVAYNPAYLMWAVSVTPGEQLRIGFTEAPKPALFTPSDDEGTKKLVMPVRLP